MAKRKKTSNLPPRRSKRLKIKNGEVVKDSDAESHQVLESIEHVEPRQPPLLALPAELRNRIYEYALKEPDEIEATKDFMEPGLLSVNRQIRHETRTFFYAMNEFSVIIVDCDVKPVYNLMRTFRATDATYYISFSGRPKWANVRALCRGDHAGSLDPLAPTEGFPKALDKARPLVMADVVAIATAMTARFPPGQWRLLSETLVAFRYTIGITDPEWLED